MCRWWQHVAELQQETFRGGGAEQLFNFQLLAHSVAPCRLRHKSCVLVADCSNNGPLMNSEGRFAG
jgi:hypothetical protein